LRRNKGGKLFQVMTDSIISISSLSLGIGRTASAALHGLEKSVFVSLYRVHASPAMSLLACSYFIHSTYCTSSLPLNFPESFKSLR